MYHSLFIHQWVDVSVVHSLELLQAKLLWTIKCKSLCDVFSKEEIFNFGEIQLTNFFHLQLTLFVSYVRNLYLAQSNKIFTYVFFHKFHNVKFTFRSMLHFELVLYMMWSMIQSGLGFLRFLVFFVYGYSIVPALFVEKGILSPLNCLYTYI